MRVTAAQVSEQNRTPEGLAVTDLVLQIFRLNARLLRAGDGLAKDIGLTSARWQVLGATMMRPKTIAQIGRDFEMTRQGVLSIVKELHKDGLIESLTNPEHKGSKLLTPSAKGAEVLAKVLERQHGWSDNLGSFFKHQELTRCAGILARIGDLIIDDPEDAVD